MDRRRPNQRSRRDFLRTVGHGGLGLGAASVLTGASCARTWPVDAKVLQSLAEEDFWQLVRAQYPLTYERVYLNTGGLGPAPYPVLDAVQNTMWEQQRISEHGHSRIAGVREKAAAFLGTDPEEVAFVRNATEGNATIASGLSLSEGDEVIFESHAHPGGSVPWMVAQKERGVVVRLFEPDPASAGGNVDRIRDLITPRTKVVQVSHITAPTGIRMPVDDIAALCRDRQLWFHIDGAQSAGAIVFDLHAIGCDSYATSGHKWLGAAHGTGLLYVRRDRLDEVVPTESGAYSGDYELPGEFEYTDTAVRFEPGTRDAASIEGIAAAIVFLQQIGVARAEEYASGLATYLQEKLRSTPGVEVLTPASPGLRGPMTTFKTEGVPYQDLSRFFSQEHNLRCRVVSERGLNALRVSTHIFNSTDDCDRVVAAAVDAMENAG